MSCDCFLDNVYPFQPHFLLLLPFLFWCVEVIINVGCSTENVFHLFERRISPEELKRGKVLR